MKVRVRVPASSANLGPGFDSLGLALSLYNELTLAEADRVTVSIRGEGAAHLPADPANVVARAARMVFEAVGRPFPGARIECVNGIPLSRGLGSSAAAWLGGLLGANALLGTPLDRSAILSLAARAEGHPDNVAAALCGGLTVSCETDDGVVAVPLPVPEAIRWVALIPELTGATAEARAVLPASVPRADAVFNVQRVALLLASLQAKRVDLLHVAMDDRLHQPYRMRLFPWMAAVAEAAREAGALGCVLSGAGPSLLAAVAEDADRVARAMTRALAAAGVPSVARPLDVDTTGAITETS
ncbi:MAG: homoserine kinase [Candidatus Rokuibacteriota bacterium]|nr:MAG: homoserine kinase [Candidatus Rokubacteria bacterium]